MDAGLYIWKVVAAAGATNSENTAKAEAGERISYISRGSALLHTKDAH